MKYVPSSLTRFASRSMLKLNAKSPTILVVAGVVGFGATAVLTAKATRKIDPILDDHHAIRSQIGSVDTDVRVRKTQQREITSLYISTATRLTKLYAPAIAVGTLSTVSVLSGHKILKGRHVATMMAYSGLQEQFLSYRERVAKTLGEEAERDIYEGAHGERKKNKDGSTDLRPKYDLDEAQNYLRPWFDETNRNWTPNPMSNYNFLKGVQSHMNNLLQARGHLFLNEVFDDLGMPRTREGSVVGWRFDRDGRGEGDNYVDFGFLTSRDPHTIAFCNQAENVVRLNFNIDGLIWDKI